jgi:hypothetical protein
VTITTQPAPARTETLDAAPGRVTTSVVRKAGVAVAAGSATWAASILVFGNAPTTDPGIMITDLAGGLFQLGLFVLVTAQLRTRATGTSRAAVGLLKVEYVLLALATIWSAIHGLVPSLRDDLWLGILDMFWPLSMLGMFIIGIKIAFAGRWRGAARAWPAVAESWAVVNVPAMAILGESAIRWTGSGHLLIGYVTLGIILALRPQLTGGAHEKNA